jgi:hypothetical protein
MGTQTQNRPALSTPLANSQQSRSFLGRSPWTSTESVRLTKENYLNLLYGRTPTIWEPNFVSPAVAWEYEKRLSPQLTPYTHNTGPLLTKVGVAQFEYQAQTAEDFTKRGDGNIYFSFLLTPIQKELIDRKLTCRSLPRKTSVLSRSA